LFEIWLFRNIYIVSFFIVPPTVSTLNILYCNAISSNAINIVSNNIKTCVGSRAELHAVKPTKSANFIIATTLRTSQQKKKCEL
jgi:hypothetical protein